MTFCLQEEEVVGAVVVELIWNPCHQMQVAEVVVGEGAATVRWQPLLAQGWLLFDAVNIESQDCCGLLLEVQLHSPQQSRPRLSVWQHSIHLQSRDTAW